VCLKLVGVERVIGFSWDNEMRMLVGIWRRMDYEEDGSVLR
jgi:hypothetical protein